MVTSQTAPHQQGGYWCDVCQCLLKDSMAYLDHINGKKRKSFVGGFDDCMGWWVVMDGRFRLLDGLVPPTFFTIHVHTMRTTLDDPWTCDTDQRALGFSMRVERVGVDKVKGRLATLKKQEEAQKNAVRFLIMWIVGAGGDV